MALSQFLDPKNDLAFRTIFGTEPNKHILVHFLNDIFKGDQETIIDVTYLKTQQEPQIESQRQSIVDILCTDKMGKRFIVEMQLGREKGFEKRAQYYAAKAYIGQREKGGLYKDLKEVIFLAIMNFIKFEHKSAYISRHVVLDEATHERDLKDFSFTFIELPKFTKKKEELTSNVDRWLYFLKYADETKSKDLPVIIGGNPIIQEAYDALDRYSWSEGQLWDYEGFEMKIASNEAVNEASREDGLKEGLKEGRRERYYEIAQVMLSEGDSFDKISRVTGLNLQDLEGLRKPA